MAEKLVIEIDGKIGKYKNALKKAQGETKNLSDALNSVAKRSAVAFAGLAGTIFGVTKAFRVQEQAQIRTEQTLKATGFAAGLTSKEIFNMASELQKVTTFGDEAIITGQNLLLTFRNIGKDTFPRATEIMLDMSTAMGTDLKSSAIQLGKALNDPTVGLTALSRVGITFTDQQKEQIKTMQQTGDIAGAQSIILKELEMQFGGTARAATNGTGAFIQLKNTLGDIAEQIGAVLAPTLITASKALNEFLENLKADGSFAKTAATIIAIGTAVTGLVTGLTVMAGLFLKVRAIMAATIPIIQGLSLSFKGLAGATGIGLLLILITDLALNWETRVSQMQNIFKAFTDNMAQLGAGLAEILLGVFTLNTDRLSSGLEKVKNATFKAIDEIADREDQRVQAIKDRIAQEEQARKNELEKVKQFEAEKFRLSQETIQKKKQLKEQERSGNTADLEEEIAALQEKQTLLTEEELIKLEERQALKEEQDLITKAKELERQGKHEEALAMLEDARIKKQAEASKKEIQIRQQTNAANLQATQNFLNAGAQMSKQGSEQQKNLQTAAAIASTYAAANRALANPPGPPATIPLAASTVALGLANVARIRGVKFAKGGMFSGGLSGVDSIPAVVQRGEVIAPTKSFDEVVEGTARQRGFVQEQDSSPGTIRVMLEPVGDLVNFIEQKIVEARVQNTGIL